MKILLVANYVPDQQESMRRFAMLLERELAERGHEVRTTRPEPYFGRWRPGNSGPGKWLGYLDKFVRFPARLKREADWADLVHVIDHSNAMYTRALGDKPHLVTCHDLLAVRAALGEFPAQPTRWSGRRLQAWIRTSLAAARYVVCDSEATRRDLARLVPGSEQRSEVVYLGLNHPYGPLSAEEAAGALAACGLDPARPYLLHVGGDEWYKNRRGAVEIFAGAIAHPAFAGHDLVLAGRPPGPALAARLEAADLAGRVRIVEKPSNQQLNALYARASALLFPSWEEGFGWPVLEAQACGCPVVTSRRAPMTEVAGEAALFVDPADATAAAALLVERAAGLSALAAAGRAQAERFSNAAMIRAYERIYRSLVA